MTRGQVRSLWLVAALFVVLAALPTPAQAAARHVGQQAETTVPFEAGEIQPDLPAPPFLFHSLVTTIGEPDKKGRQRIKMRFDAENTTNKDYVAIVAITLLDEEGATVVRTETRHKIDDEERESFGKKFKLAESEMARVVSCKLVVTAKVD